jgi:hypothetical protein
VIDVEVDQVLNLAAKVSDILTQNGEVVFVNQDADESNEAGE